MATLEEQVRKVFESVAPLPDDATMSTEISTLNLDSLDLVELIQSCEDEFDVTIDDDDAERLAKGTLGQLVDHIRELQSQ